MSEDDRFLDESRLQVQFAREDDFDVSRCAVDGRIDDAAAFRTSRDVHIVKSVAALIRWVAPPAHVVRVAKRATKIKDLPATGRGGIQALYRMDPPHAGYEYVVASAASVLDTPETYLFPADADGKITKWGELDGSSRGHLDHDRAIRDAGYEVVS